MFCRRNTTRCVTFWTTTPTLLICLQGWRGCWNSVLERNHFHLTAPSLVKVHQSQLFCFSWSEYLVIFTSHVCFTCPCTSTTLLYAWFVRWLLRKSSEILCFGCLSNFCRILNVVQRPDCVNLYWHLLYFHLSARHTWQSSLLMTI